MKIIYKAIALSLAFIIIILPVNTIFAAEYYELDGVPVDITEEQEEYGHSTFSVILGQKEAGNMSFEVPLYVTMAAIGGQDEVLTPTNYSIINTSAKYIDDETVDESDYDIIVSGIQFTKLEEATYSTVVTKGSEYHEMVFSIGGIVMPAISRELGEVSIQVRVSDYESIFYSNNQYTVIPPIGQTELSIPLVATLSDIPNFDNNKGTSAQFKVCYTVSPVNAGGDILGSVYAGDDKVSAGLE